MLDGLVPSNERMHRRIGIVGVVRYANDSVGWMLTVFVLVCVTVFKLFVIVDYLLLLPMSITSSSSSS